MRIITAKAFSDLSVEELIELSQSPGKSFDNVLNSVITSMSRSKRDYDRLAAFLYYGLKKASDGDHQILQNVSTQKNILSGIQLLHAAKNLSRMLLWQYLINIDWTKEQVAVALVSSILKARTNENTDLMAVIFAAPTTTTAILNNFTNIVSPKSADDYRISVNFFSSLKMNAHTGIPLCNGTAADMLLFHEKGKQLADVVAANENVSLDVISSLLFSDEPLPAVVSADIRNIAKKIMQKLTEKTTSLADQQMSFSSKGIKAFIDKYLNTVENSLTSEEIDENSPKDILARGMFLVYFTSKKVTPVEKANVFNKAFCLRKTIHPLYQGDFFPVCNEMVESGDRLAYTMVLNWMFLGRAMSLDPVIYPFLTNLLTQSKYSMEDQNMKTIWDVMHSYEVLDNPLAVSSKNPQWLEEAQKKYGKQTKDTSIPTMGLENMEIENMLWDMPDLDASKPETSPFDPDSGSDGFEKELSMADGSWYKTAMLEKESSSMRMFLLLNALMLVIDAGVYTKIFPQRAAQLRQRHEIVEVAQNMVDKATSHSASPMEEQAVEKAKKELAKMNSSAIYPASQPSQEEVAKDQQEQTKLKEVERKKAKEFKECQIGKKEIEAIIAVEGSRADDVSSAGAVGTMQLLPATWEEINQKFFDGRWPWETYSTNPKVNRIFGTRYLNYLKDRLNAVKPRWKANEFFLIAAAYNAGFARIERCRFDPAVIKENHPGVYDYAKRACALAGHEVVPKIEN